MEEPDEPTGWTVTADGQVYGHAALWNTCHTGKTGRCVVPPKNSSGYRFYRTGMVETEDGDAVATGRITLGTGHASLTASPTAAAEHYDNTGTVVADVVAKDGRHGIWVTGALRPDVSPERIRELRGASLSGDWRNIGGKLEMLGLLAVNVPGFPVPRAAASLAASGAGEEEEIMALVAAGITEVDEGLDELETEQPDITDEEFAAELDTLQAAAKSSEARRHRKIAKVMREYKNGTLKSSTGEVVKSRKQALAIALSESRMKASAEEDGCACLDLPAARGVTAAAYKKEKPVTADAPDYKDEKAALMEAGWEVVDEGKGWCVLRNPDTGDERTVGDREEEGETEPDDEGAETASAEPVDPMDLPAAYHGPRFGDQLLAASFTSKQREKLAKAGKAMSDGSFPIRNRSDLSNAIQSVARASDPEAAKRWIIKRARALKAVDALPASWNITASAEEELAAAAFEESKHPRYKKGDQKGGQFAPKGSGTTPENATEAAVQSMGTAQLKKEWESGNTHPNVAAELKARGYGGWARDHAPKEPAVSRSEAAQRAESARNTQVRSRSGAVIQPGDTVYDLSGITDSGKQGVPHEVEAVIPDKNVVGGYKVQLKGSEFGALHPDSISHNPPRSDFTGQGDPFAKPKKKRR